MPFGALVLVGAVLGALLLRARSKGASVVGQVQSTGSVVNLNPIMGERRATVRFGQQVRVNLSNEYRLVGSMSDEAASPPLLPLRGEDGGFQFRTATVGRQQLTFQGDGRTFALDFDVVGDVPQAAGGLRWPSPRR